MRRLSEIKFDIEMVDRELSKMLLQQTGIDKEMSLLDRRRVHLERELAERLQKDAED